MAVFEMLVSLVLAQGATAPATQPISQNGEILQQAQPRDYDSEQVPIVVTGQSDQDSGKLEIVGSRIPRKPLFPMGQFATNTTLHGLTPGSGMDPMGSYSRTLTFSECRADDELISETAACLLIASDKDFAEGDRDGGIAVLRSLALSDAFSPYEQLEAAKRLYALGDQSKDDALRAHALGLMLENKAFPAGDRASALRTLAAISLRSNDHASAIEAFAALDQDGTARPQELANLAVLQRQSGDDAASDTMRRAIARQVANGSSIPPGWEDFANTEK